MEYRNHYENYNNKQVIGMLYVPNQVWEKIYEIDKGFKQGTIFSELDKPWIGGYGRG